MHAPTRERIVELADRLFYERGYAPTSFADIAGELGISRGNFYHHFPTKDAILDAVIVRRLEQRQAWLEDWERQGPEAALRRFIDILTVNQTKLMTFGCPVGGLCQELARLNHPAQPGARKIAQLFIDWLDEQFAALGLDDPALAPHLFARSQGIAALANITEDAALTRSEVAALHRWLDKKVSGRR